MTDEEYQLELKIDSFIDDFISDALEIFPGPERKRYYETVIKELQLIVDDWNAYPENYEEGNNGT